MALCFFLRRQYEFLLVESRPRFIYPLCDFNDALVALPDSLDVVDVAVESGNVEVEVIAGGVYKHEEDRLTVIPVDTEACGGRRGLDWRN